MSQYYKTHLGIESLKQRSMDLNARQRRLLLLIGTEDFDLLNQQFKNRIATPELLEQLVEMELIASHTTIEDIANKVLDTQIASIPSTPENQSIIHDKVAEELIETSVLPSSSISEPSPSQHTETQLEPEPIVLDSFSFDEVKDLMAQLLQQNCGLMAKQLINRIQQAQDSHHLKQCQMQWITTLQESRIKPYDLNRHLKQINFSLKTLVNA